MSPRKIITPAALKGRRPAVHVFVENGRVKVSWREHGRTRYETWADSPANRQEARAWAKGRYDALLGPPEPLHPLTTRQLWDRYEASAFPSLAPRTQALYAGRWRKWELFIGPDTVAESVATAQVDEFRQQMVKRSPANQVRHTIRVVKIVYGWADQLELLNRNRVTRYRFKQAKSERTHEPAEYRLDEWEAMLRALGGGQSRRWKAWAATLIAGSQGERINAILHLEWPDFDEAGGRIRWRAATNKQGRERWQPLTWEGYSALLTARWWAARWQTESNLLRRPEPSPWVFPAQRDGVHPMGYQAYHNLLRAAERESGVPHLPFRAAHGFRKMAAGNVAERTGDALRALRWIGDTDPRRAKEYVKLRDEQMQAIADDTDTPDRPKVGGAK